MAKEPQQVSKRATGNSESSNALENGAAFSIDLPLYSILGKRTLLTKVVPFRSKEPVLLTKIQVHQEWALARLKALSGSDKFIP